MSNIVYGSSSDTSNNVNNLSNQVYGGLADISNQVYNAGITNLIFSVVNGQLVVDSLTCTGIIFRVTGSADTLLP